MAAIEQITVELLMKVTAEAAILGKERILERIPEIYAQHILNYVGPQEQ